MLNFIKLIDSKKAASIFILGLISGGFSFLFLSFINLLIQVVLDGENSADTSYIIFFVFLMLGFIWTRRALSFIIIKFSQRVFWSLRTEVLHTLLKANFYQVNSRRNQIHASLVQDINVLTDFSLSIINFLSALIMTVGCFIYMGLQSVPLFLLTLGVSIVGIVIYWIGVFLNKKKLIFARELEDGFMKSFIDILAGFKEIHMNPKIGQDIFNKKIRNISNESYLNNTKAFTGFLNIQITGEVLFYSLIAFILLYSSYFVDQTPASIVNFVFILLYLLGSINTIMLVIPQIVSARISSGKINRLRAELSDERFENYIETVQMPISEFKELKVSDLSFSYETEKTSANNFGVGPLSFSIKKGESIFIYGGNGSGKTTMINVILGILKKDTGKIEFNDTVLDNDNYGNYRSLFSVVFSDFYLFDEVYGIENTDGRLIEDYLEMFELTDKVTFNGNSFSSSDLSTGQRKRLALINVLIRSKPILVLDEWAADQDPVFRRKFYTEIIPQLKERGFTILAITHDDAYYHLADKLYKMSHGSLSIETIEIESE